MLMHDAIEYMPSLRRSNDFNERFIDFKKNMGIACNGRESVKLKEYSGYLVASVPKKFKGKDVLFPTEQEAIALRDEIKEGCGKECHIMSVWVYYSDTLDRISWRSV